MRAVRLVPVGVVMLVAVLAACRASGPGGLPGPAEGQAALDPRAGGMTTTFRSGADSFSRPARNFARYEDITFARGKPRFNDDYRPGAPGGPSGPASSGSDPDSAPPDTAAPSPSGTGGTEAVQAGLGPVYNAASCLSCHVGHGGGLPPDGRGDPGAGLLVKLGGDRVGSHGEPLGDPIYREQLRTEALGPARPDAQITTTYEEQPGELADGTPYSLRAPTYQVSDLSAGPLAPGTTLAPRLAPPVIGLGLLEAIPESRILAAADPADADGDGIRGRANRVWDLGRAEMSLGRFGWKASQPTVEQQSAAALRNDMGVTSPLFGTAGCAAGDGACPLDESSPVGGPDPRHPAEMGVTALYELTLYTRTLAVPATRSVDDPAVLAGSATFDRLGCSSCHTRTFTTGPDSLDALSGQTIHPYTDLLIHDLGPGLADGRREYDAGPADFRTAPLWGLGRRSTVSGPGVGYLHDGRARTVMEAILWHGGEAQAARDRFSELSATDRADLLRFLDSL